MQPAMDGETMKTLEQIGIRYDGISGEYKFKGSSNFFFDFKKHEFTLDNVIPENCFPVMGPDKAFGDEMVTALYAQLEQYLIKDLASRDKIKKMLAELKKMRTPVAACNL